MAFMDKNFLLKSETARKLYFEYAEQMPIFDFHCHLNPQTIFKNPNFKDISEAWLDGDHYKWRLMRSMGIDESYITGNKSGLEKFKMFAKTLEYSIGNPLYHWAHLELQRYFDEHEPLTEKNAEDIYHRVNEKLQKDDYKVRNFITKSNVKIIFTTDDPVDSLEYHQKLKDDTSFDVKVLPAFRPDKALNVDAETYVEYINTLSEVSKTPIKIFGDLKMAIRNRIDFFQEMGCVASDHAFSHVPFEPSTETELNNILVKALSGNKLTTIESDKYKTALIQFLASEYSDREWVMEIHLGVIRNNNDEMFKHLGVDTGYDTMGDYNIVENLAKLLNSIACKKCLPKTILFSGNPKDNYPLATLMASFQNSDFVSKMQMGTAWWFNDHINGMTSQINTLSDVGVLGKFIGMLTDSRSFLSYPRHEYFRRILCNIIGTWVEDGEYNNDLEFLGKLVTGICYTNSVEYFTTSKGK
jgi:glucuronate isomerase